MKRIVTSTWRKGRQAPEIGPFWKLHVEVRVTCNELYRFDYLDCTVHTPVLLSSLPLLWWTSWTVNLKIWCAWSVIWSTIFFVIFFWSNSVLLCHATPTKTFTCVVIGSTDSVSCSLLTCTCATWVKFSHIYHIFQRRHFFQCHKHIMYSRSGTI